MSVRTKLLSGRNINTDSDFSKYIETVSEPGVIEGLAVSTNSVAVGKCWCPCERTNGETIYALVESFSAETIDTSGTGYVIVTIGQNYIDDGSLINEDGTGVATFEVVNELPTKNYLLLATLNSGSITDSRNMIKKVGELNTAIESLTAYVNDINERVEALEEAGAIDHLEEQALVGERYNSTSQSMFVQKTPALADCTVEDCHVGDTAANTEIHIQRIANGTESNKLKLKVKMEGSPTTALKVEVRKGVQVNVSNTEAYWYGDESQILATGSLAYSEFSTAWAEKEFTLDNAISVDKGTLLDIVVYQESSGTKVVNASNYYKLACDSTQWSEAFSFVSVNGSTRTRSKLMPYCISGSFAQSLLSKASTGTVNGFFPKLKTQEFTGSSGYQSGSAMSPNPLTINETEVRCRLYKNTSRSSTNNKVGFRITGRSYQYYFSSEFEISGSTNDSGWKTITKTLSETIYLQIISVSGQSSTSGPVYLDYYERTTQAISKNPGKLCKPKTVGSLGSIVTSYLFGRLADGTWRDGN